MLRRCAYAPRGRTFETENVRRLFCSERCRRSDQNAARREARAEARAQREAGVVMGDPWASPMQEEGDIWSNALLDALPVGLDAALRERSASAGGRPPERAGRSASFGVPADGCVRKGRPSCSGSGNARPLRAGGYGSTAKPGSGPAAGAGASAAGRQERPV